jgi:RHH-type transcriptional regulator, proline utilization regulon repressor / proline dehydrogenase / delta 1-pyrroline-5-carboxylate dehydrogenase
VLHFITYKADQLPKLLDQINAKGYGLTMGLHTRIDETINQVIEQSQVGNLYINRNVVGAVVGVQPFGGEGLSGTGPKAGGPLYLYRLIRRSGELKAQLPNTLTTKESSNPKSAYASFQAWVKQYFADKPFVTPTKIRIGQEIDLQGPTGEKNSYTVQARHRVLSIAHDPFDAIQQCLSILSVGSRMVCLKNDTFIQLYFNGLPLDVQAQIDCVSTLEQAHFDAVLHHGTYTGLLELQGEIAARSGPLVSITHHVPGDWHIPVERLLIERSLSVNTAAAGGNASLMTMN